MEFLYSTIELVRFPMDLWFDFELVGAERLSHGPKLIACNHNSYLDPFLAGYACRKVRRHSRFLAKSELFKNPLLGAVLRKLKAIPVYRQTSGAESSLRAAEAALNQGEMVFVFAEGTIGPGLPLLGLKSGAARLSAATNIPITPMALWGGQAFWPKGAKNNFKRGKSITIVVGDDVEPPHAQTPENSRQDVAALTALLTHDLTRLVEKAKGLHHETSASK